MAFSPIKILRRQHRRNDKMLDAVVFVYKDSNFILCPVNILSLAFRAFCISQIKALSTGLAFENRNDYR